MVDMVNVFLAVRPEHGYARKKLYVIYAPHSPKFALDRKKWEHEEAVAKVAQKRNKTDSVPPAKKTLVG